MDRSTGNPWPAVILIYALSVASAMVVSEGVPALGGIAAEFHPRSPAAIGLIMSIPALVVALGGILTGWVVDRIGDKRILLIGGLVVVAGDVGVVASTSIPMLLFWRVIGGLGYLGMAVAGVTMVMRVSQGSARVVALALWSTVIPASFIAAFASGALLLASGWRSIFEAHAAALLVLLALGLLLPARRDGETMVSRTQGMGEVLRAGRPYALGGSFAAAAFLQSGMIAILAKLLAIRTGATEAQVQSFGIVAMLFNMGGAFAVGALLNLRVPAWLIGLAGVLIAGASAMLLGTVVNDLSTAIGVDCALMFGCGLLAGMWALLPRVAPSPQTMGATSGLVTQLTLLGVLFGAPCAFLALGSGPVGFAALVAVMLLGTAPAIPIWLKKSSGNTASDGSVSSAAGALH